MKKHICHGRCAFLLNTVNSSAFLFGSDDFNGVRGDGQRDFAENADIALFPDVSKQAVSLEGHSDALVLFAEIEDGVRIASVTEKLFIGVYHRSVMLVHIDRCRGEKGIVLIDREDLVVAVK